MFGWYKAMFVVVSGCFLVEYGVWGCKYAFWCDIWQVWGGLGCSTDRADSK